MDNDFGGSFARLPEMIIKKSFGLPLVLLGFMIVYFTGGLRGSGGEATVITYLVMGFGFAITLAGVLFMAV